jgi:transketolase
MPGSPLEFKKLFNEIYANGMINYFRLPETTHGIEFQPEDIQLGRGIRVREGKDVTLAVVGAQLRNAITAADTLSGDGISAEVLYFPTIKPFDKKMLRASLEKTRRLVSIEELSAHDGLYSLCLKASVGLDGLVAAQLAVEDFIHGYGTYDELCNKIGLSAEGISSAAKAIVNPSNL